MALFLVLQLDLSVYHVHFALSFQHSEAQIVWYVCSLLETFHHFNIFDFEENQT